MSDSPFSPAATAAAVHATLDQALAAIPPGKRAALLVDYTGRTAELLLAARVGDSWQVAAGGTYDGHKAAGSVAVMGAW